MLAEYCRNRAPYARCRLIIDSGYGGQLSPELPNLIALSQWLLKESDSRCEEGEKELALSSRPTRHSNSTTQASLADQLATLRSRAAQHRFSSRTNSTGETAIMDMRLRIGFFSRGGNSRSKALFSQKFENGAHFWCSGDWRKTRVLQENWKKTALSTVPVSPTIAFGELTFRILCAEKWFERSHALRDVCRVTNYRPRNADSWIYLVISVEKGCLQLRNSECFFNLANNVLFLCPQFFIKLLDKRRSEVVIIASFHIGTCFALREKHIRT